MARSRHHTFCTPVSFALHRPWLRLSSPGRLAENRSLRCRLDSESLACMIPPRSTLHQPLPPYAIHRYLQYMSSPRPLKDQVPIADQHRWGRGGLPGSRLVLSCIEVQCSAFVANRRSRPAAYCTPLDWPHSFAWHTPLQSSSHNPGQTRSWSCKSHESSDTVAIETAKAEKVGAHCSVRYSNDEKMATSSLQKKKGRLLTFRSLEPTCCPLPPGNYYSIVQYAA